MNWWEMRLAIDGQGRLDPGRLAALRGATYRDVLEMHLAQDAVDDLAELAREEAKNKRGRR